MFIQAVRIVIPLVFLQLLTGCQSDEEDKLKSEIELLKQEIQQLTEEVGKIEDEVKEMKNLAFNPPRKEPPTLPNQPNFDSSNK